MRSGRDKKLSGLKSRLRIWIAIILAIVLLALFFRNSDPSRIWAVLRGMNPAWFILGLLSNFAALCCRAARWRLILRPTAPPPLYPTFFATTLGFMGSAILPVRAGDVIRPALLSRRTDIRFASALGTVLTERILDLCSILLLFSIFVFTSGQQFATDPLTARKFAAVQVAGYAAIALLIVMLTFLVTVYFFNPVIRRLHEWLGRLLPVRFRESWMRFFDSFVQTTSIVHHRRAFIGVLLFTAGVWAALSAQFFFVAHAAHHPLPFTASFFLTGMTILGMMIPTPGAIGGFHKACQIALVGFYNFDVSSSVAVAVAFHIVGTAPVIIAGFVLLSREHLTLGQLARIKGED